MNLGDRGQSEVLGVALIFAIVITVSVSILVVSSTTLGESQAQAEFDSAEQTMTKFDSQAGLAALEYNERISTHNFGGISNDIEVRDDDGWMRVTVETPEEGEEVVMEEDFNSIVYTNDDVEGEITYQAGGVWKSTESGKTMVSPPEFHFRDQTITIPMVNVNSDSEIGDTVQMSKDEDGSERFYPTEDDENPLDTGELEVAVQSDYYEAWGTFFSERTSASSIVCDEADDDERCDEDEMAVAVLEIPFDQTIEEGISATASGERLSLDNNMDVRSYDSTETNDPTDGSGDSGTVVVEDGIDFNNPQAQVSGDVITGGEISTPQGQGSSNTHITGDLTCPTGEDCIDDTDSVDGEIIEEDTEFDTQPANFLIDGRVGDFEVENNNDDVDNIVENNGNYVIEGGESIPSGDYYLDEMKTSDTITLDTTGGNIRIAVDGDIDLDNAEINVNGDNRVEIYMDDTESNSVSISGGQVGDTDNYDPSQFWIYTKPGADIEFSQGGTEFVGVVYAAGDNDTSSSISIEQDPEIFGGLVGNVDNISQGADLYYDENLVNADLIEGSEEVSFVTYLHISKNEIEIE